MDERKESGERALNLSEADLRKWPWLGDHVECRGGKYFGKCGGSDHGDSQFRIEVEARRLGIHVPCVDSTFQIDVDELRRRATKKKDEDGRASA